MVQVFIQQAYLFKGLCFRLPTGAVRVMWVVTGYMQNPSSACSSVPDRCCFRLYTNSVVIPQLCEQSRLRELRRPILDNIILC